MKKKVLLILTLGICGSLFALSNSDTSEISIYNEINSYYQNGYYPGVVERTDILEKNFSESIFITPALLIKTEALLSLGKYAEAEETCQKIIPTMHFGSEGFSKSYFLLGKACFYQNKYDKALDSFYKACSIAQKEQKFEFYNPAMLYGARAYFAINQFSQAVPLFEYTVANGSKYSSEDYDEALQKLFICYAETGEFKKTVSLYEQLSEAAFAYKVFTNLKMYAADAYEKILQPEKAYELYSQLIENENTNVGVTALKKAYVISSQYKIDVEPAEVLEKINKAQINPDNVLAEFWTRLGIDSYKQKDFSKAKECFSYAKEKNPANLNILIELYELKIQLDEAIPENKKEIGNVVTQKLLLLEPEILEKKDITLSDTLYSVLLYTKAYENSWRSIPEIYEKITQPDAQVIYLTAASWIKAKNYQKAQEFIKKDLSTPENLRLYASILANLSKTSEAEGIYSRLQEKNLLTDQDKIEFAKVLCKLKKWDSAEKLAKEVNQPISKYLEGICQFNKKNYENSKNLLKEFVKSAEDGDPNKSMAIFYAAYSSYKLSDYESAYSDFELYTKSHAHDKKLTVKAYELSARAAILSKDYDKAAISAQGMISKIDTELEKFNASIFCAQIYTDAGKFSKAVDTLEPFTKPNGIYAAKALYQIASIYKAEAKIQDAEKTFVRIYTDFPQSPEAEEAMYQCGELYYSIQDYEKAEDRFTKYIYKYVNGKFSDSAYYFSGECNLNTKNYNRSIMQNKNLLLNYPQSIYAYTAGKNLLTAYYATEKYQDALEIGKMLVQKFNKQATLDDISDKIWELEQIVAGTDKRIAEKLNQYQKAEKTKTKKGRIIGSELVQIYGATETEANITKAFELAKELLEYQTDASEMSYGADNADFIAKYYRAKEMNLEAAEMYLKAAEFYRSSGIKNSQKAAAALYSATEAFIAANSKGDAQATAKLLKELYPDSKQAERINSIVN